MKMPPTRFLSCRDRLECGHGGRVVLPVPPSPRPLRLADLLEATVEGCCNEGPGCSPCTRVVSILRGVDPALGAGTSPGLFSDLVALTNGVPSSGATVRLLGPPEGALRAWPARAAVDTALPEESLPLARPAALGATGTEDGLGIQASLGEEMGAAQGGVGTSGTISPRGRAGGLRPSPAGTKRMRVVAGDRERPGKQPQPPGPAAWRNDLPAEEDRLGIADEIQALTEAILLGDIEPPFVVAILGAPGAGKSSALRMIVEEVANRRALGTDPRAAVVGHPYIVHYNAWIHGREELWWSLRRAIFEAVNTQMAMERHLFEAMRYADLDATAGAAVWRVLHGDRGVLDELSDDPLAAVAAEALDDMEAGRRSSDPLWECLERGRKKERDRLSEAQQAMASTRTRLEEAKEELERQARCTLEARARREAWKKLAQEDDGFLGQALSEADLDDAADDAVASLSVARLLRVLPLPKRLLVGLGVPSILLLAAGALAFAVPALLPALAPAGVVVGLLFLAAAGVQSWLTGRAWVAERQDLLERRVEAVRARIAPDNEVVVGEIMRERRHLAGFENVKGGTWTLAGVLQGLEDELKSLEVEAERLRRRAGLTVRWHSLTEFIETPAPIPGDGDDQGLRYRVREDLEELSDALLSAGEESFPRGKPRVLLLVDDLDHCEPKRVAEFLEATQLLLNAPVFLTVVAMDLGRVSRALNQVLPHAAAGDGGAALSYLEKIVQIPYRLRPMRAEHLTGFLAAPRAPEHRWQSFLDRVARSEARSSGPEVDERDLEAIRLACARVGLGPREIKRLVNIHGLLSSIWARRAGELPPFGVRQAAILLLTLGARHAAAASELIDELADRFERESIQANWKLQSALVRMCRRHAAGGDPSGDWEDLVLHLKDRELLSSDLTLNEFGVRTTDLLRAFGFLDAGSLPVQPLPEAGIEESVPDESGEG